VTIWESRLLYVFVFFSYIPNIFAPPLSILLQLQLLLPKPSDDTSGGEATHGHRLGHGFHRRGAIANSKDAADIGFVERWTCLDDALVVYTQSELLGERTIGCGEWCGDLNPRISEHDRSHSVRERGRRTIKASSLILPSARWTTSSGRSGSFCSSATIFLDSTSTRLPSVAASIFSVTFASPLVYTTMSLAKGATMPATCSTLCGSVTWPAAMIPADCPPASS
jgi:hypothetical protein